MTVVPVRTVAGRFSVTGDQEAFDRARWRLGRAWRWVGGGEAPPEEASLWLRGVDRRTGAPVLIEERGALQLWAGDLEREAAARCAGALGSPYLARVLHAGPGVVYAEPPRGLPRGAFSVAEAAELALQACEAAGSLHAAGVGSLCFDPRHLRVVEPAPRPRIAWIVPGAPVLEMFADLSRPHELLAARRAVEGRCTSVGVAVWGIVDFFLALLSEAARDRSTDSALRTLAGMHRAQTDLPGDVAALARLLLPLLPPSPSLLARALAIPSVAALPPLPLDWDAIIAEGEPTLAAARANDRDYLALPLAAAYHQRASRSCAAGDLAAALTDADRAAALDGAAVPIATTRAVLLDALGRPAEAKQAIDAVLGRRTPADDVWAARSAPPGEARAHGTRGMIALRAGAFAEAEADLRCALDRAPPAREAALFAHALGAARYALGDSFGAVDAEERSVAIEPANARYRWALVRSLLALFREREAREQAEAILASEPEVAAHRARFARLFGWARWYLEVVSVPSAHAADAAALGAPVRFPGERIALDFPESGRLAIGRSPGIAKLPFAHGSMGQNRPYGLALRDGKLFLIDHGAGNPASHNGDPLRFCAEVPLAPGDEITVGGAPFVLRVAADVR